MLRYYYLLISLVFFSLLACQRTPDSPEVVIYRAPFFAGSSTWADSILSTLTLEDKIGQLLLLRQSGDQDLGQLTDLVRENKIGALSLSRVTLDQYLETTSLLQGISQTPLLLATDQQISPNNQLTDQPAFPLPATIGALKNEALQQTIFDKYFSKAKALNMHLAFSPELDEQRIGDTLFNYQLRSQQPTILLEEAMRQTEALTQHELLSIGRTFRDLVYVKNDTTGIVKKILHPYQQLVDNGLSGLMINEKLLTNQDVNENNHHYLVSYLQKYTGFDGLLTGVVADTSAIRKMLHAGIDILVVDSLVNTHIDYIKDLIQEGSYSEVDLNQSVHKILMAKSWLGLSERPPTSTAEGLAAAFDRTEEKKLVRQVYTESITLAWNPNALIPFDGQPRNLRVVHLGDRKLKVFDEAVAQYTNFKSYHHPILPEGIKKLNNQWTRDQVVITIDGVDLDSVRDAAFIESVNQRLTKNETVIVNFGNPFNLQLFDTTAALIQVFENNSIVQTEVPKILFGGRKTKSKLPLRVAKHLPYNQGFTGQNTRLTYVDPEAVGIDPVKLVGIDALVKSAIQKGVTPGAQVMLIKDGQVFYQKSFGHHNYDKRRRVTNNNLYDIASITKVAATTLATMKLYEQKQINVNHPLNRYLPLEDNRKMGRLSLKKLLTHQSRLQSNMPISRYVFYKDTVGGHCNEYFCKTRQGDYNIKIADSIYMKQQWVDTLWKTVYTIIPKPRKRFKYSDVNFNLLQKIIETKTGQPLDQYVQQIFYDPLGLRRCLYNPLQQFSRNEIVPTAMDDRWREQQLHGYVHDESAALLGGVAGSAGLFANANDLGIIFQMLLNGGHYGGQQFLKPETIKYFTSARHGNHRGLGFDTKRRHRPPSCGSSASKSTYGHTGFTGTCVWVDPAENLIYIFLSNRIAPDAKNKKLFKTKLRSRIHNLVYKALGTYEIPASSKKEKLSKKSDGLAVRAGELVELPADAGLE